MGRGKKKGLQRSTRKLLGVMSILSVVMLSQAHTHLKTFQIVYFAYVEFIMSVMPQSSCEQAWEQDPSREGYSGDLGSAFGGE